MMRVAVQAHQTALGPAMPAMRTGGRPRIFFVFLLLERGKIVLGVSFLVKIRIGPDSISRVGKAFGRICLRGKIRLKLCWCGLAGTVERAAWGDGTLRRGRVTWGIW
jgi:hypothetical protein